MPKRTSKKKPRKNAQNRKAARKAFSESEVGVLIEDLDHKMDLLLEGFSSQGSRIDKIEKNTLLIQEKILTIEDKLMMIEDKQLRTEDIIRQIGEKQAQSENNIRLIEEKQLRTEDIIRQIGEKQAQSENNMRQIEDKMAVSEDKLIRLEAVVASLADTVAKNTQHIQALQSEA